MNRSPGLIDFAGHLKVKGAKRVRAFAAADAAIGEQFAALEKEQPICDGHCFREVVSRQ